MSGLMRGVALAATVGNDADIATVAGVSGVGIADESAGTMHSILLWRVRCLGIPQALQSTAGETLRCGGKQPFPASSDGGHPAYGRYACPPPAYPCMGYGPFLRLFPGRYSPMGSQAA